MRFDTDRGTVWVVVSPLWDGAAEIAVYEQECALASWRDEGEEIVRTGDSASLRAARNRFGISRIRPILRQVKAAFPSVCQWYYDSVRNANPRFAARRA